MISTGKGKSTIFELKIDFFGLFFTLIHAFH